MCPDFDLCENCEALDEHNHSHIFLKIRRPTYDHVRIDIMRDDEEPEHFSTDAQMPWYPSCSFPSSCCAQDFQVHPEKPEEKPMADFDAKFGGDVNYPDQSEVLGGQMLAKEWTVRNSGSVPFPPGTELRPIEGTLPSTHAAFSVPTVAPGACTIVRAVLALPSAPGPAYSAFRLHTPAGVPFGDTLWVNVVVVVPADLAPLTPAPSAATPSTAPEVPA